MKESEFARNQRLQREAIERTDARSEVALELAQQTALLAAQSRDLQRQQLANQEASLQSQHQHQWAIWSQTDDGRAYLAWENSAQRIVDQSERRDRDLAEAHRADVAELVTADERAKQESGVC